MRRNQWHTWTEGVPTDQRAAPAPCPRERATRNGADADTGMLHSRVSAESGAILLRLEHPVDAELVGQGAEHAEELLFQRPGDGAAGGELLEVGLDLVPG